MKTGNIQLVKKMNKSAVLEHIKQFAPLSRADIAQNTGLNKGTVSSLVSELINESFVYESGPGQSSGGRRPVLLHFNSQAGYTIGIDIGVNYLLGIITDLEGHIVNEHLVNVPNTDFQTILQQVFYLIDKIISQTPDSTYGIIGIGIGIPGITSINGDILFAPNLGWQHIDLKHHLQQRYHLPVIIENEASAGAYGEKLYGAGQTVNDLVYVSAGIGIGTGIILNGKLFRGVNGYSGEMGHMSIDMNGKKCSCGNIGCWELYASEQALLQEAEQNKILLPIKNQKEDHIGLEELITLAKSQNQYAIKLFENAGVYLGIGIINIINTFNPSKIIIGNRLAAASEWITPKLHQTVKERALSFHQTNLDICFSKLSFHSSALGVSAFVVEHFIQNLYSSH